MTTRNPTGQAEIFATVVTVVVVVVVVVVIHHHHHKDGFLVILISTRIKDEYLLTSPSP